MADNPRIWLRPLDIAGLQSLVFERLAKEGDAVLVVYGKLAGLPLPREFECPLPGEQEVSSRSNRQAFKLTHQSWRPLCNALQEADWKSERLSGMEITIAGEPAFLVGDSFHAECVSLGRAAPRSLSRHLEEANVANVSSGARDR